MYKPFQKYKLFIKLIVVSFRTNGYGVVLFIEFMPYMLESRPLRLFEKTTYIILTIYIDFFKIEFDSICHRLFLLTF